jgi:methylated-DNA-[protein]-cysteine S-methyltransferase
MATTTAPTARMYRVAGSPVGALLLAGDDEALTGLRFWDGRQPPAGLRRDDDRFAAEVAQLEEYFAGRRTAFTVPLRLDGPAFERRVWDALLEIPHGSTASYGEIAERIGAPGRARAVGGANARNPVSIIVPCHRVIGADGGLVGYGGGLERKRALLAHEGAILV